jgi:hypothetical protein
MHEQAVSLNLPLVLTRQQLISVDVPLKEAGHTGVVLLTVKLSHLLAEFHFTQHSLELRLVDQGNKPPVDILVRLAELWLQHLETCIVS